MNAVPIFIISRDRLTPLRELIDWLERAGHEQIFVMDIDSAYPPLLEYYETINHTIVRIGENAGPYAFWDKDVRGMVGVEGRYVLTDSDVVPDPDCPLDAVAHFEELLNRHQPPKVGFGLRIDDLPDSYGRKAAVISHENQFWDREIEPHVYNADLDTTFALCEPWAQAPGTALRTGFPYVARHVDWYQDSNNRTEEQLYYISRAHHDGAWSHWSAG